MDVRIVDYGENAYGGFISYNISGLSQNQLEFLNNNLDDETQIINDNLILKTKFKKEFFPFQSFQVARVIPAILILLTCVG